MTTVPLPDRSAPRAARSIDGPADLQRIMGTDYAVSDQQWQAVSAPLEPAVVIAGAGSGKTTLMAARVVYLVVTGQVRPDQVLGLTFTTKAASELRRKIHDALVAAGALDRADAAELAPTGAGEKGEEGEERIEPTVLTYNAYAAQLLTEHGLRIGHEPDTRVVTDAARYQLGARVVDRFTGDVQHLTDHPPTAIQNLLALNGAMSEHLASPDDVRGYDAAARAGFERALAEEAAGRARKTYREPVEKAISAIDRRAELLGLVADYRRLKAELGLMDFSDQIELGARLAAERSEVGEIERGRFAVVLLDEYQDTSVAQATMLSRLFSGPDAASGRGHPVTAVGDPNQAIYGWRGASVSNIVNFAETFPPAAAPGEGPAAAPGEGPGAAGGSAAGGRLFHLTVSRRSDARILEAANRLAGPLYDAYDQVAPLEAAPGAVPGRVRVAVHETAADELAALAQAVAGVHTGERGALWSDVAVLTRDNAHAEDVFDALTTAGIPVEIVGLKGLLRLPEVAEVVATLHLLHDVTDNPSMLTLLTGPRWAIGPRDLRLLSRRAMEISGRGAPGGQGGRGGAAAGPLREQLGEQLVEIADGVDPAELPALDDALADPGAGPYSDAARERFGLLTDELRYLRAHVGEPLLDLVRRIIDASGVDVELASSVSPAAGARRDNLDLFVKAVADFQAVDGDVTLPALLAYLTAEDDQGNGLDLATPSEADSVKLLTVHRAKGLEWASVFLVGVCETRFPSNRSRTLWTSSPAVLPAPLRGDAADLPQLLGHDKAALEAYRAATRAHDAEEELRLGYVAVTRPAHLLAISSYCWGPRPTPFGPSAYQRTIKELVETWGEQVEEWREKPERGDPHPYAGLDPSVPWPPTGHHEEARLRREAAARVVAADPDAPDEPGDAADDGLDMITAARVAEWDEEIDRLLAEARRDRADVIEVDLPPSLSATAMTRLRDDAESFARDLARPMPRPPSPAARFGTRFHAWVEARFGQLSLLEVDELSGRGDADVADDAELAELVAVFEKGEFADRVPVAVEPAFAIVLGGQVVRGRIDAIYAEPRESGSDYLVVDWKTSTQQAADPLQLAIYRLAWAELRGVDPERVRAGFYYVRSGDLVEPERLPGRDELARLVDGTA